jgi:hypothetical protein
MGTQFLNLDIVLSIAVKVLSGYTGYAGDTENYTPLCAKYCIEWGS